MKQKLTITLSIILVAMILFFACNDEELPLIENTLTNKIKLSLTLNKVNGNSADLTCSITNMGNFSINKHGICWNNSENPTTSDSKIESGTLSGNSFNKSIENLNPDTDYYVKAYIIIKDIIIYSQQTKITTTDGLAGITTTEIADIKATTATSGGNITDDGGFAITARGVCWSTSTNPTIADSHTTDGSGTGSFISNLTGLAVNTTYYVRSYATNSKGTVYGNEQSFTTEDGLPSGLTTTAITDITATTATSGGNITGNGGFAITARGVCWSTSSNPTITDFHTTDGSGMGSFSSSLTGLTEWSTYYVRAYATNSNGTAYGDEVSFTTIGTSVTDYDGNVYEMVQIGNQIWMAENLKTTHYADGTEIPLVTDITAWTNLADNNTDDAYCYYNNDANSEYGALYTWAAAMNGAVSSSANPSGIQGACPDGWHLPSDAEWTELTDYLGGAYVAGGKMKEIGTTHWNSPNTGATNESGFTALPGGGRYSSSGSFSGDNSVGYWWSSTDTSSTYAYIRRLLYSNAEVIRSYANKSAGLSVRCLKD